MLKSQIRGRAQKHPNGPKWVQNGRQASRIHPNESYGHFQAFGTSPADKNLAQKARNPEIGRSVRPLSGSTPQVLKLTPTESDIWAILGVAFSMHP